MSQQTTAHLGNLKLALIEYARVHPLIWDRNINCTKKEREDAWIQFADGFNHQVQEVRKRWEGMRRMYVHELRASLTNGKKSEWVYFTHLDAFLRKPVESLMKKFAVSKVERSSECIELSSNDESEELPSSCAVACKSENENKKESAEGESSSTTSSDNRSKKSFEGIEKPVLETSQADSESSCPSVLLPRLVQQGEILVTKKVTLTEAKGVNENDATNQAKNTNAGEILVSKKITLTEAKGVNENDATNQAKNTNAGEILVSKKITLTEAKGVNENDATNQAKNTNAVDDSKNATPLTLTTTEDVRNELRKIPPIKMSTLLQAKSLPLKPKYPAVSSSKVISNRNVWKPNKLRLSMDNASSSPRRPNKPKAFPLSKRLTMNKASPISSPSTSLTSIRSPHPPKLVKDSSKDESAPSSPVISISEDISEYATLNPSEDTNESSKKKDKSKSGWFKEKMLEWRREASKLSKENTDCTVETDSDTNRESRKNFLLSFLPDIDEMSAEQRVFFKSKIMNLISHRQ